MKKKTIGILVAVVLAVGLFLSFLPWPKTVSIRETVWEYRMDGEEPLSERELTMEGTLTRYLWKADSYEGSLTVSGIPETEGVTATANLSYDSFPAMISYLEVQNGQPMTREPGSLYCDRSLEHLVITLMEIEADGHTGRWSRENGRVLCRNAPNREMFLRECEQANFTNSQ